MILNICYYLFAVSSCCATAFGFFYIYDKKKRGALHIKSAGEV